MLHPLKSVVSPNVLVKFIKPPSTPHEPKRILGYRDRRMRHSVYKEALVKWKDFEDEAFTWEQINML